MKPSSSLRGLRILNAGTAAKLHVTGNFARFVSPSAAVLPAYKTAERPRPLVGHREYPIRRFDGQNRGVRSNARILDNLFASVAVRIKNAPFISAVPAPLPADFDFDRIEGMMLGLAIGDALGTEAMYNLAQRRQDHFVIRDYI